jgi:hypothetical protein
VEPGGDCQIGLSVTCRVRWRSAATLPHRRPVPNTLWPKVSRFWCVLVPDDRMVANANMPQWRLDLDCYARQATAKQSAGAAIGKGDDEWLDRTRVLEFS